MILANDFLGDFARPVTTTYLKFLTILTKLDSDGSLKDCQKKNLFCRNKIPHFWKNKSLKMAKIESPPLTIQRR